MTSPVNENQAQDNQQQQPNNKELNFRALEAKYQRQLEQERAARLEAERIAQEAQSKKSQDDDDSDSEPYVDHKKLDKRLNKFGQTTQSEIQKAMEIAKQKAKEELKQEMWLENNPDFYEVLQHADKFAQKSPRMAETILKMPEGFERQKLVYESIKELGVHKPEEKKSTIQDKVNANRQSPFYQPSGVANAPYAAVGDFSPSGQKNAYDQMQKLKAQLRI